MLTKAIVERLNTETDNHFKVYIPLLQKANDKRESAILDATLAYIPGITNYLKVGDVVFVDFEDDLFNKPVIISKLFLGGDALSDVSTTMVTRTFQTLDNTQLSTNTLIGDVNPVNIAQETRELLDNEHVDARNVIYDNSQTDYLSATNVQEAIDELSRNLSELYKHTK